MIESTFRKRPDYCWWPRCLWMSLSTWQVQRILVGRKQDNLISFWKIFAYRLKMKVKGSSVWEPVINIDQNVWHQWVESQHWLCFGNIIDCSSKSISIIITRHKFSSMNTYISYIIHELNSGSQLVIHSPFAYYVIRWMSSLLDSTIII